MTKLTIYPPTPSGFEKMTEDLGEEKELTDEERAEQVEPEINEEARLQEYNETGNKKEV